jgi:hypothetical protein
MSYKHDQKTRENWARQKRNQRANNQQAPQQEDNEEDSVANFFSN